MFAETTLIYLSARTSRGRLAARKDLHYARRRTDNSLSALVHKSSPNAQHALINNDVTISSWSSLADILFRHRAAVPVGPSTSAVIDQIVFYGDIIDSLSARLRLQSTHAVDDAGSRDFSAVDWLMMPRWVLQSLAALVDCVNHIGAEQSSCVAFRLLACTTNAFGLRETFVYAQAAFTGDAYFRSYVRLIGALEPPLTDDDDDGVFQIPAPASSWRQRLTDTFPQLELCRRNVMYNFIPTHRQHGSTGAATPGSRRVGCDRRWWPGYKENFGIMQRMRRNNSVAIVNTTDVDRLADVEMRRISQRLDQCRRRLTANAVTRMAVSLSALVVAVAYTLFSVFFGPVRSGTTRLFGCHGSCCWWCANDNGQRLCSSNKDDETDANHQAPGKNDELEILKSPDTPSDVNQSHDMTPTDKHSQCTDV